MAGCFFKGNILFAITTKPFVPSIWGRLHEPKENYAGSGTRVTYYLACEKTSEETHTHKLA